MKKILTKTKILTGLLLILLFTTATLTSTSKYSYPFVLAQAETSDSASIGEDCFSIFHIGDTQTLTSAANKTYLFNQQCQWIVNNTAYFNNKMVIHTGDIQDNGNITDQWISANNSMSLFVNNTIPYAWCAGNHDLYPMHVANSPWLGDNYAAFNPQIFVNQNYWVSNFSDGKNTATKFSYVSSNGTVYNFLVVMVEYDANSSVLTWMTNLINSYQDFRVIVGTHDYMDTNGKYTDYGAKLSSVLDTLPNVVLVLCGHAHDISNPTQVAHKNVNGREEIEWDLQDYDTNDIGSADVQILTFNFTIAIPTVEVSTYQTYAPTHYLTNQDHNYTFSLSLHSEPQPIPTFSTVIIPLAILVALAITVLLLSFVLIKRKRLQQPENQPN